GMRRVDMRVHIGAAAVIITMIASACSPSAQYKQRDSETLAAIEQAWLDGQYDRSTLERILGDDFVHPVSAGVFLTKAQHIDWAVDHQPPSGRRERFDRLQTRTYGDVGIVTGVVISTGAQVGLEDRTIFTDVFVRRHGQWQAVNAQENGVQQVPSR